MKSPEDSAHPEYDYSVYYREYHNDSEEHVARMMGFHRGQLGSFLPPPGTCRVLDIGCGMGFALLALREMGFTELLGIDVSEQQVESCRRQRLSVQKVEDTALFLREHLKEFDLIMLLDVLEHIPLHEQIGVMRAVHSALKPGGRVILQVPNASSILAPRHFFNDFTHHWSFTEHSLRFVLKNAGFERIEIPGQRPLRRPSFRVWRAWARAGFLRWLVRRFWQMVLTVELGQWERTENISLELNLISVAYKS